MRRDLRHTINFYYSNSIKTLVDVCSKIHLIMNVWFFLNIYAVFDVKCRFVNQRYQVQNILFNLSRIPKAHSGVKLAKLLFEVLKAYRCTNRVGFLVSDNASTLNTIINSLEEQLTDAGVDWPAIFHRIRCWDHIVYFSATVFLKVERKIFGVEKRDRWRRLGCYNKLHNIVVWIQQNSQRTKRFRELSKL